jgi:hypothetical protein
LELETANGKKEKVSVDLSDYLNYIEIVCDYANCTFPFISVMITVPKRYLLAIQSDLDTILFIITVQKMDGEDMSIQTEEKVTYIKNMICKPFNLRKQVVEPPENPKELTNKSFSEDLTNASVTHRNEEELNESSPQYEMFFQLFKLEHLLFNKILNPTVYSYWTVGAVVADLIKNNCPSADMKFLIQPSNNETVYEQIILPPYNLINSLQYLQNEYGVFKNGIQVFFDFKYGFIMDPTATVPGSSNTRKTIIELYSERGNEDNGSASGVDGKNMMHYAKTLDAYLIRTTQTPTINTNTIIEKELSGEVCKFSGTSDDSWRTVCRELTFNTANNGKRTKENAYWNTNNNEYAEYNYLFEKSKKFGDITMAFPYAILSALDINKEVEIVDNTIFGSCTDIQGKYKIERVRFFIKGGIDPNPAVANVDLHKLIAIE